jgi:hypothetical protein
MPHGQAAHGRQHRFGRGQRMRCVQAGKHNGDFLAATAHRKVVGPQQTAWMVWANIRRHLAGKVAIAVVVVLNWSIWTSV